MRRSFILFLLRRPLQLAAIPFLLLGLVRLCHADTITLGNGVVPAANGGAGTVSGALKGNGSGTVSQAGAADLSNGTTGSGATVLATAPTISDPTLGTTKAATGGLNKTSDVSLAAVPGLAVSLTNGKTYVCTGHLLVSASGASGGVQVAIATTDTLTASSLRAAALLYNGTTLASNGGTGSATLPSTIGAITAVVTDVYFNFTIIPSATGTLQMEAAQNASNSTTTTIGGAGTWLKCDKSG